MWIGATARLLMLPLRAMRLGRIFRRMGLPPWTFAGVGISAIWFTYIGSILEKILTNLLSLNPNPARFVDFLPAVIVFLLPFLVVIAIGLWQNTRRFLPSGSRLSSRLRMPAGKRGLILLVSREASASFAIDYHIQQGTLEWVWLIPSDGTDSEQFGASTLAIAEEFRRNGRNRFVQTAAG
jgi:hypothetical protein